MPFTIYNGTDAELTNVNVGGTDVPARSFLAGVAMTAAEVNTLITGNNGVAVMNDAQTANHKGRAIACLLDDALGADYDLGSAKKVSQFKIRRGREDMADIGRAIA